MEDTAKGTCYQFAEFIFDRHSRTLYKLDNHKHKRQLKIEPQVSELLAYFLERQHQIIPREDLVSYLWPKRIVGDDALRSCIKKLREALDDNAKSPRFIKTLPMKGYEFIGHARVAKPIKTTNNQPLIKLRLGIAASLFMLATVFWYGLDLDSIGIPRDLRADFGHDLSLRDNQTQITPLTDMSGSELLPSYNPVNQHLLFSHRANKDDFLQLYIKNTQNEKVTRLTWDSANYGNAMWSPAGDKFAYIRSTPSEMYHYLSEYEPSVGITNTIKLDHEILSSHYLLGWSSNTNGLYLTDKTSPASPQGIWLYNIDDNSVQAITSPSVPGQGDYFVKESFDGSKLAILRSLSLSKHELLVLHLETGEIVYSRQLPAKMHRLVWDQQDSSITMGSFDGALLRVNLGSPEIQNITPQAEFVNNVFYQCGDNCYFMRQHNGNYLDIAEQPNPFQAKTTGSFAYYELSGANDFPMYANTSSTLYFVSQHSQSTAIEIMRETAYPKTLFKFDASAEMQSIALNMSDTHFVGLLDSSLFVYDIKAGTLSYLSKQTDIIYPPHWIDQDHFVYARLEKNEAIMYRYSILDKSTTFLMRGYIALLEVDENTQLLIDKDLMLWRQNSVGKTALGVLPSSVPNRLTIAGNYLYYTGREENTNTLSRLRINTGQTETVAIAKNRFKAHFDMSSDRHKLVVVESLLAQSDLVKVEITNR